MFAIWFSRGNKAMNILTFDIEEWYTEKALHGDRPSYYLKYDHSLNAILDLLDEVQLKGTFFCVGQIGYMFPEVVRRIYDRGHEIGCHSNTHTWLNKMGRKEVYDDTRQAIDSLQQCIGQKVVSYRAPSFSIGKENIWVFETLAACGIERDASVYPAKREVGGFSEFGQQKPIIIKCGECSIKEYPICTTHLFGRDIAYSGGGYFRFFPLWFVKKTMTKNDYNMCYFHIGDLIRMHSGILSKTEFERNFKEPGTLEKRIIRYVKDCIGTDSAFSKIKSLISSMDFVNLDSADRLVDWENTMTVNLDQYV